MKQILVFGDKTFKLTVPDDSKVTFGPWSPPTKGGQERFERSERGGAVGTLRIYGKTKDEILAVFAGVHGFRDLSLDYAEEVAKEEGAVIWKDDKDGYVREDKVKRSKEWIAPSLPALTNGHAKVKAKR